MELEIWGGFFAGETWNFLVFGQENRGEDDNKEVIRVVKYSKDWERLGQASLRGAMLVVYDTKAGQGKFSGSVSYTTVQDFPPNNVVYQRTGASLGGLAETTGGYAVAYNYDGAGSSDSYLDCSVYFAYVDKDSLSVKTKMISDAGTSTPVLAPTGLNGGYILWHTIDEDRGVHAKGLKATPHNALCGVLRAFCARTALQKFAIRKVFLHFCALF